MCKIPPLCILWRLRVRSIIRTLQLTRSFQPTNYTSFNSGCRLVFLLFPHFLTLERTLYVALVSEVLVGVICWCNTPLEFTVIRVNINDSCIPKFSYDESMEVKYLRVL